MSPAVCVHGLGHIGLPTAAALAARAGCRVFGVDTDPRVRAALAAGRPHIAEPGLGALLAQALGSGRLTLHAAPVAAEYQLIAVPTPLAADRTADLSHLRAALAALAPVLRAGDCVVVESTCPVGTTASLAACLPAGALLAYCPERVLPGRVLEELVANDRVVGGLTPEAGERAAALYRRFVRGAVALTDAATAEFVKLAENSFRDANIAFANTLSLLADRHGVDAKEAIRLANRHPRVAILNPGPGVGGHCIAVDPWFLAQGAGDEAAFLRAARAANLRKTEWVLGRIAALAAAEPEAPVTLFGLAYKPDIGDLRESPALWIARALTARFGAGRVACCDPHVAEAEGVALLGLGAARVRPGVWGLLVRHAAFAGLDPAGRALFDAA